MDPTSYGMFGQMSPFMQPNAPFLGQAMMQQPQQQHHNGGFNPLMFLSPMAGMMMSDPKMGLFGLSPALGFANLLGAFK
jgi:hypothetical protein